MKTYQDKRTLNGKEWDVMVAEEGDHKVFVPFWGPEDKPIGPIIQKAQRIAEFGLRQELATQ